MDFCLNRIALVSTIALFMFSGAGAALAVNVSPSDISGAPGDTVTMAITIDTDVTDMTDWGVDIYFDTDVLEYDDVDGTGTLSEPLTVNGIARAFGARVGAYSTGDKASGTAGTLANVLLKVKDTAYKNSAIQLQNFVDYVGGATTTDATFTITATIAVTVTPASTTDVVAGESVTLTAGVKVDDTDLALTSVDDISFATTGSGSFGTKTLSSGKVEVAYTAHTTVETATITATENVTGNSETGEATVASVAGTLASLTVSPDTATKTADETEQFSVTGADANGNSVTEIGTITWSVNGGIGTIDDNGLFSAATVGTGSITATSSIGSVSDTSGTVTVNAGVLTTLTVSPDTASLTADETQQFTVTGVDADGNTADVGTITWALTGEIGAIDSGTGMLTANTPGEGAVTATSSIGSVVDTSGTITVTPGVPATMTLSSSKTTLASDQKGSATLTATLLDQDGNVVTTDDTTAVTFALSDDMYLALSEATKAVTAGVAEITVTTKAGIVENPPKTSDVSISAGDVTPPSPVTLTLVNFSIDVADERTDLVRSPLTPSSVLLTGLGGTSGKYRWTLTGVGSLSASEAVTSSEADSVTYYAPTSVDGNSQTGTIDLKDEDDPTGLNDQVTVTVYNPTKLMITSTALNQTAGVDGTVTVEVQNASDEAVTHGAFTVNLATDSTGTAGFFSVTTRDSHGITSVMIADGESGATFQYMDQKTGMPTITASAEGLTDATQQATITPDVPASMTLEAGKTTLISDAKDSTLLTATILDQYGNVVTTDSTTQVAFALTSGMYLELASPTATASAGVATNTVSSKSGMVDTPPAADGVNITSGDLTPPTAEPDVSLSVINFTISVTATKIIQTSGGTPNSIQLTGIGGTTGKYRWEVAAGDGSFSSTATETTSSEDVATYYSPATVDGDYEDITVTLTDADDANLVSTVVIRVFQQVLVSNKPSTVPTILSGASATYTVGGGDDTMYTWTVTDNAGGVIDTQTGASYTFTAPTTGAFAGMYTISVEDYNEFDDSFQVKVPIVVAPDELAITERKYSGAANPQVFTATGASSDYTWEMVEMDVDGAYVAVETPADYGTWSNTSPVTDDNTNTFSPADVSEVMRFYVRVTVENDADLTAENGLDQLVVGMFSVVPLATYTVSVVDSSAAAVVSGDVTVTEQVTDQAKPLGSGGEVTFRLPDVGSTFSYIVADASASYVTEEASSALTSVTITLESADDTIGGAVQDSAGGALADATVTAYDPSDLDVFHRVSSDAAGAYTILLPVGASQSGWTVVASLAGYVSGKLENQAIGSGVDFVLQAKTAITSVTTAIVGDTVELSITALPAFEAATDAAVITTGGVELPLTYENGTITATYDGTDEDFTVTITTDTSSEAFSYDATSAGMGQGDTDAGGGTVELKVEDDAEAPDQDAAVAVPAGGLTEDATIVIKSVRKEDADSTATAASPDLVYEITAEDSATGNALTDDEIVRIVITLPIDLSVIEPGDLENGVYAVFIADDLETLEEDGGVQVPTNQILSSDYVGDGKVGSVTFWLDHLSVLSVGVGRDTLTLIDLSDESSTSCFIETTSQGYTMDRTLGKLIPGAVLAGLALFLLLGATGRRFRKAITGLTLVLACILLIGHAGQVEAMDWDLDYIQIEIASGGSAASTSPRVGDTVQLKATAYYRSAGVKFSLDCTSTAAWRSSDTTKGTVGRGGLFKAAAEGATRVTATYDGETSRRVTMNVRAAAATRPADEAKAPSPAPAPAVVAKKKPPSMDRPDRIWYVELNGMYVHENMDVDQTTAKFSGPISVDFDESWGAQLAFGMVLSELISAEAVLEYVAPFEATLGMDGESEIDVWSGSLNGKLTCPAWAGVKPYVVAGIGLMKAYEDIDYKGATSTTNDLGVSFRGGLGVDVSVRDDISIGLEAAYTTGVGEVEHVKYGTLSFGVAYHF